MFEAPSIAGSLTFVPSVSLKKIIEGLDDEQKEEVREKIGIALLEVTLQLNKELEHILFTQRISKG